MKLTLQIQLKPDDYPYAAIDLADQEATAPADLPGADLGITNIASDSDLERLSGLSNPILRVGRRACLRSWAFSQLGVLPIRVDPRNSSRACSRCGHCDKGNRKTQEEFSCRACGFRSPADTNAARSLRERGRAACKPADRGVVDARPWHSFRRLVAAAASPHLSEGRLLEFPLKKPHLTTDLAYNLLSLQQGRAAATQRG